MARAVTDESDWRRFLDQQDLPPFETGGLRRVAVLAAHPDDETLGAGGVVQVLKAAGAAVSLIVASDGEAAFPALDSTARAELAAVRRDELTQAMAVLGLESAAVHLLGLPDSAVAEHETELTEQLKPLLRDADCVIVPWPGDPHPDHAAVGRAGLAAAPVHAHRWSYPIWAWHWMNTAEPTLPWRLATRCPLDDDQQVRKQIAIKAFESQLVIGPNGEDPIVDGAMLTHFDRPYDVLFREPAIGSAPIGRFADLYATQDDPWHTADSWYERRKRAVVLASLPAERYRRTLEPACGLGALTALLVQRSDQVIAFDPVDAAVRQAAEAAPSAELSVAALPATATDEPVDLMVLSEILYYLGDDDLQASLDNLLRLLEPGGHLLAVHWRPWAPEAPRDAAATHQVLRDRPELDQLVEHVDEDFLLHVFVRR
ncbi:PIG-L family deacetylase [Kribbella sp. NPDC051587]|uniref:PIG-L family deacetylase n=1 Tax=Kribbella sp. NPDC051587 TaxID=3364119 RepID=UPI0037AD4048